ncbi:acetyl-CoA synthetase-like protein [Phanerochaete sordida]|uniref:Acetyl-CoA synthetase-like protein n=1 Tax=Phanerochaete sordida TaxID=48140 RepID=A0A9P3GJ04_9APHY|nr:acetyl-CoA synthetase-like protein [Phanerochaete sordida]
MDTSVPSAKVEISHVEPPPIDGSLSSLLEFADYQATHHGELPWLIYPAQPSSNNLAAVSFAEMVSASHRIAHAIRPRREGTDGRVMAVILHTDAIVYVAVLLGVLRAGFVPYPISPRNSPQGVEHMLKTTACLDILAHASTAVLVRQACEELALNSKHVRVHDLPPMSEMLPTLFGKADQPSTFSPYPASERPADPESPWLIVHSSGSTGLPKSVPHNHGHALDWLRYNIFGSCLAKARFGAMGLPTFHGMGILFQLCYPLCSSQAVVVNAPQYPDPPIFPNPQSMYELCRMAECTAVIALPSFIEDWSHSEEKIEYLRGLQVLLFGGGPLSAEVGDKMSAAGVPLLCAYGGSEFGNPTLKWDEVPREELVRNPDWAWMRFSERIKIEWVPQGDGSYELVVEDSDGYHIDVYNVSGRKAFATSDLWVPHESKPGLWKIVGRKDDVITLSTGEKIVPLPQEGCIMASPLVAGCVMFGRERAQAGVLIEPRRMTVDLQEEVALELFRDSIWPVVEQANTLAPAFAKIYKDMIIVTKPGLPLARSAKGTVVRKLAISAYEDEIERLYSQLSEKTNVRDESGPESWAENDLQPWLIKLAGEVVNTPNIAPDTSLFQQGFDSLSATVLLNHIVGALRSSATPAAQLAADRLPLALLFQYPMVSQLAMAVASFIEIEESSIEPSALSTGIRVEDIDEMVAKYTLNLPTAFAPTLAVQPEGGRVVLLTGATGNVGSHILGYLLSDGGISRVYVLHRPSDDPVQRLKAAFALRRLPTDILDSPKLIHLVGDVAAERLGLHAALYYEIINTVTHIVHNAWSVNFNQSLAAFEPLISGVSKLASVCATSSRPIRLLFTSSIGIANGWDMKQGLVPEHSLSDPTSATSTGYTASKYVTEKVLEAASHNGVSATCVRMGQACGSRLTGAWGTSEWLPIMVKSSRVLGCLPVIPGPVAWVPLDIIGQAYLDLVLADEPLPLLVNLVHTRPSNWDTIVRGLKEGLQEDIPVVSLDEWVGKLEQLSSSATEKDLTNVPALKLLDFFRALAGRTRARSGELALRFETSKLVRCSPTMLGLQSISEEHARMWVAYWRDIGYLEGPESPDTLL